MQKIIVNQQGVDYCTCDACLHFLNVLIVYVNAGEGTPNLGKEVLLESHLDFGVCEVATADICAPYGYMTSYFLCLFLVGT